MRSVRGVHSPHILVLLSELTMLAGGKLACLQPGGGGGLQVTVEVQDARWKFWVRTDIRVNHSVGNNTQSNKYQM